MDGYEHGRERGERCRHDFGGMHGGRGLPGQGRMHLRGPLSEASPRFVARGGIRFAILGMLKDKPRHGYDLIREMEERSGGLYSPSPGAIYPTLQALEDEDLVTSTTEEGKKVYALSEAGSAYLEEHKDRADSHRERWQAQWAGGQTEGSGDTLREIHEWFHLVKGAVRDNAGDAGKLKEIGEVLKQAASQIREIAGR
jgi:DNA-binding PadR family transcriptional regulator